MEYELGISNGISSKKKKRKGSKMQVSECCGANFYEPGYPDNDMCSACGEHAGAMEEEEPSINVVQMPEMTDEMRAKIKEIQNEMP